MATEDDRKTKKGYLECEFSMKDMKDDFVESKKYSIDEIRDSEFFIRAHYTVCDRNLQIIVCKTNSKITYADISLSITQDDVYKGKWIEKYVLWKEIHSFIFESIIIDVNSSALRVTCDIEFLDSSETINYSTSLSDLHHSFKPLLLNPKLSDFTIVIGKEELPVHKSVLGAQSPVFSSIFESDMKGPKMNRLIVEDISANAMKNVLAYLYTRSLEALKNRQLAVQMLIAARMYSITVLEDLCECRLINQITKWNALELLEEAEDHDIKKLHDACFKFIIENQRLIIDQPNYKTLFFTHPTLIYLLTTKLLKSHY